MKHFSGTFSCKLDHKGKVSVPNRFRRDLEDNVVVAKGVQDKYLWMFPLPVWEEMVAKITALPNSEKANNIRRFLLGSAHEVPVDKVGRIQIPQALREYAQIENKAVSFLGIGNTIEIWDKDRRDRLDTQDIEEKNILKDMEELGI